MRTHVPTILTAAVAAAALAFAPAVPQRARERAGEAPGTARAAGIDDGSVDGADDLPDGCTDDEDVALPLTVEVEGEPAAGRISFPEGAPEHLVVFAHGYGHSSRSWTEHMRWAADELGAVAFAMDYRGTLQLPEDGEVGGTRGWQVREGAVDSNTVARAVLAACPGIQTVTMFGVSMGANTAGLAIAAQPTRPGSDDPLYDWWINVEGAANVVETYLEARSLAASGNTFANNAVEDIEREVGAPFEEDPQGYVDLAVVSHTEEIAASGLRGVFHVHGAEDGLVPYDQSRELWAGLRAASRDSLAQEFWTALRRDPNGPDPDEDQTNASDYVLGAADPTYESPFVGHGSEASADNDVMWFSLERLRALILDDDGIGGCSEGIYDQSTREWAGTSCVGSNLP